MILLMPTQKYVREVIDPSGTPGVDEASGPYFTGLAQFRRMFMDNEMFASEKETTVNCNSWKSKSSS